MGYSKIIQSGDVIEVWQYERNLPRTKHKARLGSRNEARARVNYKTRARNPADIRRARARFIRFVRANLGGVEHPALLTLTMYQVLSLRASRRLLSGFIDRLRLRHGSDFRYIAVPEFQKRGATHFHILIWGLGHLCAEERSTRHFARLWARGFVDCTLTDGHIKLAGYLGKYMSKSMSDLRLRGQKSYYSSRNTLHPLQYGSDSLSGFLPVVIPNIHPSHQHEFDTEWLGRCLYQQYIKPQHEDGTHRAEENHL